MSKRTRNRANRRDRRKAKESDFRREGRRNPKRVGHGGSGELTELVLPQIKRKGRKVKHNRPVPMFSSMPLLECEGGKTLLQKGQQCS